MSADASAGAGSGPDVSTTDYSEMLSRLDIAIDEATRKIEKGRVRDEEKEKVRVKQWKALGYLLNVRRQITAEKDKQELAERIEELEALL